MPFWPAWCLMKKISKNIYCARRWGLTPPCRARWVVACRKLCRTSNVWKREWYLSWRNSVDLLQTFEKNTKLSLKLVNKNFYYLWNLSWNDPGLNTCWKGRAWPPPSSPTSAPRHRQPPPQLRACWPRGFRVSLDWSSRSGEIGRSHDKKLCHATLKFITNV